MSQYVYFSLISEAKPADAIAEALGIEPDRKMVRGSKQPTPRPIPTAHHWEVHCPHTSEPLDVQATFVLERVAPVATAIRGMVDSNEVTARLVFIRKFNDPDGDEENLDPVTTPDGHVLEKFAGQHQLLGWCLEPEQLALLAGMRASIDADEYG